MSIINIKKKHMKKTLIIVAFATFIFTSCKKDYNCSCDAMLINDATGASTVLENKTTVINDTKSGATTACDAMDEAKVPSGLPGLSGEVVCSIK